MSASTPVGLLHAIVAEKHASGILRYLLDLEEMCRRVHAVAVRYNQGNPALPGIYRGFVEACYRDAWQRRPRISLVPNAVAFEVGPAVPPSTHTYASDTGRQYYILDVEARDLSLIIPLRPYTAYDKQAPGRAAIVLDSIQPVPYWIVGSGGLGVPVSGGEVQALHHSDWLFTNSEGRPRTTVYVKIKWLGYEPWHAQIRMTNDGKRPGRDSYTFKRLVNQVRGKVRKFISDHAQVPSQYPYWAVGDATHGRITANDLTLLAIVVVSQGAVMPILKLRDNFFNPVPMTSNVAASPNVMTASSSSFDLAQLAYPSLYYLDGSNGSDADRSSDADLQPYANQSSYASSSSDVDQSFYAGQSNGNWQPPAPYDAYDRPYY